MPLIVAKADLYLGTNCRRNLTQNLKHLRLLFITNYDVMI